MLTLFSKLMNQPMIKEYYSNTKILVTGGRGYLGSCLSESLSNTGSLIYLLDHSSSKWLPSNETNVKLINADICNIESYESILSEIDIIFHLAALEYKRQEFDLIKDYLVNAKSVVDIMEACIRKNLRPIMIFASSANIFGIQESLPVNERNRDNPPSLWSAHKLLAENYLSFYTMQYNFKSMILRLPNVFGPSANLSMFNRSAINLMILQALSAGVINLYGNSDCLREQIFTTDATRAFLLCGINAKEASKGIISLIGSGTGYTYRSVAQIIASAIKEHIGKEVIIKYNKDRYNEPIDQRNFLADTTYFSSLTGWYPEKDFVSAIDETVRFVISEGERII